jgi:hypothetical protein
MSPCRISLPCALPGPPLAFTAQFPSRFRSFPFRSSVRFDPRSPSVYVAQLSPRFRSVQRYYSAACPAPLSCSTRLPRPSPFLGTAPFHLTCSASLFSFVPPARFNYPRPLRSPRPAPVSGLEPLQRPLCSSSVPLRFDSQTSSVPPFALRNCSGIDYDDNRHSSKVFQPGFCAFVGEVTRQVPRMTVA